MLFKLTISITTSFVNDILCHVLLLPCKETCAAGDYVSIQLVQSALPANKASHANSMTAAHHKVVN